MKKNFTLMALAFVAMSSSAKEEVALPTPWEGNNVVLEGSTYTIPGGYKGAGTVLGDNDDKTAYDYVWIKYTGASGSPNFVVVYNEWKSTQSWGEEFQTTLTPIPDGDGMVGIKLDKETVMKYGSAKEGGVGVGDVYAKHVQQIQLQSASADAKVTVVGIYFGTKAEYVADGADLPLRPAEGEALTIWEGTTVFDGWGIKTDYDAKYFDVAEVGDIIRCYITDASSPNPVFKYGGTWTDFPQLLGSKKITATYFEGTITDEEALANLKKTGFSLQGVGFTLTKVELIAHETPKEYEAEGKALTFSADGNILSTEFAGYSDDAKVVFVTTVTGAEGYVGWGNGAITSIGGAVPVANYNVTGEGANEVVFTLKELKEALDAPGFYKDEATGENVPTDSGLNWNCWGFDDKCTSTRTSVTIYEVVGFSGEGYVPATGISEIQAEKAQSAAIFNLAGQQVSKAQKGIYIQNGKKYIAK